MVNVNTKTVRENGEAYRLQAADILLVHTKRSLWGWIIRFGTHSYWNHALIVCSAEKQKQDSGNALVVDAKTDGTIAVRRASEYLNRTSKYDVAVKRLEADWFKGVSHISKLDCRNDICNIAIKEVDFTLCSRLTGLINQTIRQLTVITRFLRRKIRGAYTLPNLPWNIRPVQVKAFTCGGFVQWCYYTGVSRVLGETGTDQSRLGEVIFNPRAKKKPTPFELLTTSPADLAKSDKLTWKYITKDGLMQEVTSNEEAGLITVPA